MTAASGARHGSVVKPCMLCKLRLLPFALVLAISGGLAYCALTLPCLDGVRKQGGASPLPRDVVRRSVIIAQHLDPALQPAPLQSRALRMLAAQNMATSLHLLLDLPD